jgi:steroid delta-isomerase-like uncharacterized protein
MYSAKICLLLLIAGLVSTPLYGQDPGSDPTLDPEGFAREYLEAWSSGEVERVLEFYTEDIVYEDVPTVDNGWGPVESGKDEMREALVEGYTAMPDMAFEFGSVRSVKDGMVVEWTMTGTHTGDWPGLPATGRSIEVRGISVIRLEEGRIVGNRDYYDMFLFLSQLGVVPPMTE